MTEATDTADTADKPWIATLKRGSSYTFGVNPATRFLHDVDVPVTQAMKEALARKAVDNITVEGEGFDEDTGGAETEPRAKFVFRKVGEEAAPEPRRRLRKA